MTSFVGGTDMPWHDVDSIWCPPGAVERTRLITEAPDGFPVKEHPLLTGAGYALVCRKMPELDVDPAFFRMDYDWPPPVFP